MYLPRAFASHDPAALDALLDAHPFVTLVTVADGAPMVSHLPVLHAREAGTLVLRGHWARPNPQSTHDGAALAIVHGPHAYVSPSWYPDKAEQARVPTWNYVVAHLHGTLERFDDTDGLAGLVADLSALHEARAGQAWRYVDDAGHRSQLRGIVGFRLRVDRAELKAKLSQNHPEENRRAVIARLDAHPGDNERAIADRMRATLAPQGD